MIENNNNLLRSNILMEGFISAVKKKPLIYYSEDFLKQFGSFKWLMNFEFKEIEI